MMLLSLSSRKVSHPMETAVALCDRRTTQQWRGEQDVSKSLVRLPEDERTPWQTDISSNPRTSNMTLRATNLPTMVSVLRKQWNASSQNTKFVGTRDTGIVTN